MLRTFRITKTCALSLMLLSLVFIYPYAEALNINSSELESSNGQFLSVPSNGSLNLSNQLTIESWVKWESLDSDQGIVTRWNADSNQRSYALRWYDEGGVKKLGLMVSADGSTFGVKSVSFIPSIGDWYHIAATYAANSGEVKFYINGTEHLSDFSAGSFGSIFGADSSLNVGAFSGVVSSNFFDGRIDDVRVWNIARSQAEIAANMNKELLGNETGLVAYWKFNGSSLEDATANNNDLINNNGATFSSDVPFIDAVEPTLTFDANPSSIVEGNSSTLAWNAQNASSCTASGAWAGARPVSGTLSVSPAATASYVLDCIGDGGSVHKEATVTVSSAPTPSASQAKRKAANESVTKSIALQDDNDLNFQLAAGKTYTVDGVLFVSAGKNVPDLRIAFSAPNGSNMAIGYLTDAVLQNGGGVLTQSNAASRRIQVPANTSIPIIVKGTIVAGASGDLQLKWAQFTSNANPVTITKGSYIAIQEI